MPKLNTLAITNADLPDEMRTHADRTGDPATPGGFFFSMFHHRDHWDIVGSKLLPQLSQIKHVAGTHGIYRDDGGSLVTTALDTFMRKQGYIKIPTSLSPVRVNGVPTYVVAVHVPGGRRKLSVFETLVPGRGNSTHFDRGRYDTWRASLIGSAIDAPDARSLQLLRSTYERMLQSAEKAAVQTTKTREAVKVAKAALKVVTKYERALTVADYSSEADDEDTE